MNPFRTTAALGFAMVALAGCGGGSDDTAQPPAPTLAAPTNFSVELGNLASFQWSATLGATRYELHADPDGSGPLAETKLKDQEQSSGTGFGYQSSDSKTFIGGVYGLDVLNLTARLNATYRLRACNATECGPFTPPQSLDIVHRVSNEFPSGRVPLKSATGLDNLPRLSKDGLTLAIPSPAADASSAVLVFTRSSSTQPWQQQAVLASGKRNFGMQIALSADGSTLAVRSLEQIDAYPNTNTSVVYAFQRNGSTWSQQAYFEPPSAPSACPQPCNVVMPSTSQMALSANGNALAVSVSYFSPGNTEIGAVLTYIRNESTWSQQVLLEAGNAAVSAMALSGDGSTLAVNEGAENGNFASLKTPYVRIFAQQGNGPWSQQARIPAGIASITGFFNPNGGPHSAMALSGDGNTLAVHALNAPGHPTPELDLKPADLSCGGIATDAWYIALYARNGSTWQRQTAISRGIAGTWALASDGNALFYGNTLFSRSNGAWACP